MDKTADDFYKLGKADGINEACEFILMGIDKGRRLEMAAFDTKNPGHRMAILRINQIYGAFENQVKES